MIGFWQTRAEPCIGSGSLIAMERAKFDLALTANSSASSIPAALPYRIEHQRLPTAANILA